jgi:anti-sigma factor RsiW
MKCDEIREMMPDLAAGFDAPGPEVNQHLQSCADCATHLAEFCQTMALMDEWKAPEPSPYFDVRLRARLREEAAKPAAWWHWLRKPALAISLAVLMVASITLVRTDAGHNKQEELATVETVEQGTAVGDLLSLDKNSEIYSDFDLLDDMQAQEDVNANP